MTAAPCTTPRQPKLPSASTGGTKGCQLLLLMYADADGDKGQNDREFERHDGVVEIRGFLDANHQQHGNDRDDDHGRDIQDGAGGDPAVVKSCQMVPPMRARGHVDESKAHW